MKLNTSTKLKRLTALVVALIIVVGGAIYIRHNDSDKSKITRIANLYHKSIIRGDTKQANSLESESLSAYPDLVTSESSNKIDVKPLNIVAIEVNGDTAAVTGTVDTADSGVNEESFTPFLIKTVKEQGKWKVSTFNIGLITEDEAAEGAAN